MRSDARKRSQPCAEDKTSAALGAALILLDRTEDALRIIKAERDTQAVQLDEIRRVAAEWAEDCGEWPDDYLRGYMAGMAMAGEAVLGRLEVPETQFQPLSATFGGDVGGNANDVIRGRQIGESA